MATLKTWSRKQNHDGATEITAAAAQIDLGREEDQRYLNAVSRSSKTSGARPWKHYHGLGEVHYGISRSSRVAGYASFQCVNVNADGSVGDVINDGLEADIASRLYSPYGGTRGLIERYFSLMKITGDSYLIRVTDEDGDDGYQFLSADEIDGASTETMARNTFKGIRWITLPSSSAGTNDRLVREVAARDVLGRVWTPSHRWIEMPDSPLMALDIECELLRTLTESIKAKLKSRFALAGLLFLPTEIQEAQISGATQTHGKRVDDVMRYLISAMTTNVNNWDEAAATAPIILRGPGDAGEKIRHILMDRELLETDIKLRAELIGRILFGMDIQQQATAGNEDQNHWGAWSTIDDERRVAIQPDLENLAWALTRLVLYRELKEAGMPSEQIVRRRIVWDLSAASIRTNQQEDTRQANDRGYASGKAIMRTAGLDTSEEMTGDEYVRWVGLKTTQPRLMLWGTKEYDQVPWEEIEAANKPPGPPEQQPGDEPLRGPGVGDPGSPDDKQTDTPQTKQPAA